MILVSSKLKLKNDSLVEREKAVYRGETFTPRRQNYDPFQSNIPSHLICCEPTEATAQVSPWQFVTFAKKLVNVTIRFIFSTFRFFENEVSEKIRPTMRHL